jgi:phenylalanyl-tRNA synthetase beta chain
MNISYNWLRELTGARLTAGELRERLTMAGLEVEAVHDTGGGDFVLEIAALSNRPDLLSHVGVAREVCTLAGGGGVRWPEMRAAREDGRVTEFASVEVQAADLCSRFTARVVRGVRVAPSPAWLVERLLAVRQVSINNVADITNYVMLELGQPLHAFDLEKLDGRRLVVRRAREGELLTTLDGTERKLDAEMLVIADASRPVAVAGVMGGNDTKITGSTRDVLIEAAHFAPASVRRTTRALGYQTDASDRFERGVDPEGQLRAQARAVALITELAGGTATTDTLDFYPQPPTPIIVPLRFSRVRELTGLDVPPQDSIRILGALGIELAQGAGGAVQAGAGGARSVAVESGKEVSDEREANFVSPSWRIDLRIEEDLVEEVGRHFGYDKVSDTLPAANVAGEYGAHEGRRRAARRALNACGFDEALNFSFIDTAHDEQFELLPGLIGRADESSRLVTLSNPVIEDAARMRPTLLAGLLESVRNNFNHGTRDVRLYEMGRVFAAGADEGGRPREIDACALVATGVATEEGHAGASRELDFYDLKGALEAALAAANVADVEFAAAATARHLREGQAAQLLLAGRAAGTLGRLADDVAAAYKFKQPVYVAEVDFSVLLAAAEAGVRYAPLARYPAVMRDASLVAPRRVTFAEMQRAVVELSLEQVRRVALVYVYEGEGVPEGRRSVTLRIEYRADDRTLRDEEVDELHGSIIATLEEKFGAQLKR